MRYNNNNVSKLEQIYHTTKDESLKESVYKKIIAIKDKKDILK